MLIQGIVAGDVETGRLGHEPRGEVHLCSPRVPRLRNHLGVGNSAIKVTVFDDFEALDVGGSQTIAALKADDVQIGLLFSTDPSVRENGFLPLVDDKHLQNAENITPVIRSDKLNNEVRGLLDAVSARLSTENVTELVGKVVIDKQHVAAVAREFLTANGLL